MWWLGGLLVVVVSLLVAFGGLLAGPALAGGSWKITDLGDLGGGWSYTDAINAAGAVVGESAPAGNPSGADAFYWTPSGGMVDLGTLPGGTLSFANGLNRSGEVVGYGDVAGGNEHGFMWTPSGGMVDLGTLGGSYSEASGVNASGQVVGGSWTSTGAAAHAFLWTASGGMVDLTPSATSSVASLITDQGEVLGIINTSAGVQCFVWSSTAGLTTFGGSGCNPYGITSSGVVYGSNSNSSGTHAFIWSPTLGLQDLGTNGGVASQVIGASSSNVYLIDQVVDTYYNRAAFVWTQASGWTGLGSLAGITTSEGGTEAFAINDSGLVVGQSAVVAASSSPGSFHAFAWTQSGGMVDLGSLGGLSVSSGASAVNASGEVAGWSQMADGTGEHAVVWTPTQQPQSISFTSSPPVNTVVGGSYTVSAAGGGSGNPVTFSIDGSGTAGACTIAGTVVRFTGLGTCLVDANQAGNAGYLAAPQVQQSFAVLYTSAVTGVLGAKLTVGAGQSVLVGAGASVNAKVTVTAGGSLVVQGATITAPISASAAKAIRLCGSTVSAPLTVTGTTGPVLVGGAGCAGNTFSAPVNITGNTGGVGFSGNTSSAPVTITGNSGGFTNTGNTFNGPHTISGNT